MAGEERSVKVKIDNVRRVFNTRNGEMIALNGVSLDIMENEFICVVGPSGCGKSTLLNIIAGLLEPTSGKVYCDGKEVTGTGTERGVVFQQYALFPWMTVKKNVMFGLNLKGIKGKEAEDIAMKYIKMVQLEDFVDHYPKELSGGMKQCVAIARALSNNPKVLLSDEATSALDPDATESILKLLRDLNKRLGITIILITHEMSVIKSIANRVAVMENGKVVEEGDVYDIFANPKEEITKKFINSSSSLSNITKLIENKTIIPTDCKLVKLTFTRDSVGSATISKISREYNVDVNIMLANVDVVNADALGGIIASIEGTKENVQRAIDFLHESNVKVEVIHHA